MRWGVLDCPHCVLLSKLAHCALDKLLHEQNRYQAPEELSTEAREAVDVVTPIEDSHDDQHDACPDARPPSPRQKVAGAQPLLVARKGVHVPIGDGYGLRHVVDQKRLTSYKCLHRRSMACMQAPDVELHPILKQPLLVAYGVMQFL